MVGMNREPARRNSGKAKLKIGRPLRLVSQTVRLGNVKSPQNPSSLRSQPSQSAKTPVRANHCHVTQGISECLSTLAAHLVAVVIDGENAAQLRVATTKCILQRIGQRMRDRIPDRHPFQQPHFSVHPQSCGDYEAPVVKRLYAESHPLKAGRTGQAITCSCTNDLH